MIIIAPLIIIANPPSFIPHYEILIDREEMEMMVYPDLFQSVWSIWGILRNVRTADPCAQASSTCQWIWHNRRLIYAVSWMQLFLVSTLVNKHWDADSLETDWTPCLVFIWGACHQPVDGRWMLCSYLCWRGPLSFVNLDPLGCATFQSFFAEVSILLYAVLCSCWKLSHPHVWLTSFLFRPSRPS